MTANEKAAADVEDTVSTQLSTKCGSVVEMETENDSSKSKNGGELKVAKKCSEMFRIWPYQSFLIVIMEFSIMLTALNNVFNLYYINVLGFDPDTTVVILSTVGIIGGLLRLIGSSISDGYLGKFRAIFYGSCFYILGKIVITFSTFLPVGFPHPWLDFSAQLIIIVGTSAMGPSIAPFGGDQFEPHQEKMISVYYSIFYASINIGAVISNMVMPILRSRPCFGKDSCYPLSFSVSTIGVICSFLIFIVGSKRYVKLPPKGNVFMALYRVVKTSKANKNHSKKGKYDKFLDYYFDTHNCEEDQKCLDLRKKEENANLCQKEQIIDDFRALKRLLIIFIPMPMFWALYDQQYTVWMNQALLLDGRIWGDFRLLPDQMQVVNPILIIVLIFLFQSGIYPFFERFVRLTPLRKMVAGGFIAAFAFVVSGIVQLKINLTLPDMPQDGHSFVSFVNAFQDEKCTLNITHLESGQFRLVQANSSLIADKLQNRDEFFNVELGQNEWKIEWINNTNNVLKCSTKLPKRISENIQNETNIILIGQSGHSLTWADTKKPTGGTGQFKIGVVLAMEEGEEYSGNLAICRVGQPCDQHMGKDFYAFVNKSGHPIQKLIKYGNGEATQYPYIEVRPGSWNFYKLHNDPMKMREEDLNVTKIDGIEFEMEDQGGIYTLFISGNGNGTKYMKTVHQVAPPNSISILWQLPQILVISIAEILVSITGLEFAYSQSGLSMKAIAHACWGITSSLGSIIIIILTKLPIENLATKAFVCAGAMVLDVLLLAYLATFKYQYRKGTIQQNGNGEENDGTISRSNKSMGKGEKNV